MEYDFFKLISKAYPIVKREGYIKGETSSYIKNNYDLLPEGAKPSEVFEFTNWIENKGQNAKGEYSRSLGELRASKTINENNLNLLLSALGFYFKDLELQKERDNNPSEFVGNIGDIISFTVKEKKVISYGNYGSTFYRLVGTDNNIYMWSTSSFVEVGDTITAKVKDHRDYRGEKQTVITRGKINQE